MEILDVVLAVETDEGDDYIEEEILEGIAEHKDTLRNLQGTWGRLIADLEEAGLV